MVSSFGEPFSKAKRNQKRNARTAFPVRRHFQRENDQVEQLAANTPTIPLDAIASLLQRLVRPCIAFSRRPTQSFSGNTFCYRDTRR